MLSFFRALNTHFVSNFGVAAGAVSMSTLIGFISTPSALLGLYHRDPLTLAQFAGILATMALSFLAALFGMPKTIGPSDATQVAQAAAAGDRPPITPAKP